MTNHRGGRDGSSEYSNALMKEIAQTMMELRAQEIGDRRMEKSRRPGGRRKYDPPAIDGIPAPKKGDDL